MTSTIKNPTPFYAVVGAGDALVAKVRSTDPAHLKAPQLKTPQIRTPHLADVKELPVHLKALPEQLRELQTQAQTFANGTFEQVTTAYSDFAKRGETVVDDVRKRDVVADVKGVVSKLQKPDSDDDTAAEQEQPVTSEAKATETISTETNETPAEETPAKKTSAKKQASKESAGTKAADNPATAKSSKPTAAKSSKQAASQQATTKQPTANKPTKKKPQ